jgi:signal transduction histidine kinase/CheY-like chemotaxis protein
MKDTKTAQSSINLNNTSIKHKFKIFSYILLTVIFLFGTIAFFISMRQIGYISLQDNLSLVAETIRLRLATDINSELSLVCKMADSNLIRRYFSNPFDPKLKEIAIEEFAIYRRNFKNNSVFWVNDLDKLIYYDDQEPYHVNPTLPENYWYNMTLYETEIYNFNINYNPDWKITNLWVNAPVFTTSTEGYKKPLGMVGTAINITNFIDSIIKLDSDISVFFFNDFGEITASKDQNLVLNKVLLEKHLGDVGNKIITTALKLQDSNIKIFIHENTMYGVCSIPELKWYLVDSVPISFSTLINPGMAGIFCSILILITLIVVAFNIFVARMQNTLESQNEQLVILNKQAIIASKAKSSFIARTSHEIRTPMNAIIGLSELAQREHGTPKALEYITGIKSAGTSLLAIVNDILDFSKIEADNLRIFDADYEVISLLNDVLTIIRVRIRQTSLELILNISNDIPMRLIGDMGRIKQILLNMLTNAVKYTNKGFIKFSAFGEVLTENSIRLTFIVEDSGIGIKPEDMPKLFGEFMRVDEKRNISIEGTGLGLVIARNLCRAMSGDMTVQSVYGQGSIFTATLIQTVEDWKPMGDMAAVSPMQMETQRVTFVAPEAEVLVVDDFASNLLVAEGLLKPYGLHVFTCLNGREAVSLVQARSFDLVLMDHMMPEMDGVEAVAVIRGMDEQRCRTVPIIALTANAVPGMKEMFLENGFNDFIAKPIDTIKLDSVLKKWIPAAKRLNAPESDDSTDAESPALPTIEGVDTAAGLARIGGSHSSYLELLAMFRRDATSASELLSQTQDESSLRAFTTLVHALKSALANIGADGLSQAAARLEKAGREADLPAIRAELDPFRAELAALTARLGEVATSFPEEKKMAKPEIGAVLAYLQQALEAKDIDAIYVEQKRLQALPLTEEARGAVSEIVDLILTMEFQKATDAVNALRKQSE